MWPVVDDDDDDDPDDVYVMDMMWRCSVGWNTDPEPVRI
jgi:hypothetical protein